MCKNCETRPKIEGEKLLITKETAEKPPRPICLELMDAKADLFAVINDISKTRQIPFYLLESIVIDAARQVSELAEKEREAAKELYKNQLKKAGVKDG